MLARYLVVSTPGSLHLSFKAVEHLHRLSAPRAAGVSSAWYPCSLPSESRDTQASPCHFLISVAIEIKDSRSISAPRPQRWGRDMVESAVNPRGERLGVLSAGENLALRKI